MYGHEQEDQRYQDGKDQKILVKSAYYKTGKIQREYDPATQEQVIQNPVNSPF